MRLITVNKNQLQQVMVELLTVSAVRYVST